MAIICDINGQPLPIFYHMKILFFVPGQCRVSGVTLPTLLHHLLNSSHCDVWIHFPLQSSFLPRSFKSSPTQHTTAVSFFSCSQEFFTLVSMSDLFFYDETNVTVIFSVNSLIKSLSAPSRCLISISAAPFVLIFLSPDTSDLIHNATVAESILISTTCSLYFRAIASSSATLMWAISSFFHSQAASSTVTPPISNKAPSARLLASHHITLHGSSLFPFSLYRVLLSHFHNNFLYHT